nr:hypothetical protein [Methylobacterium sp. WSM2598]
MTAVGEKPETIAAALRISVARLQRDYRDALLHGHARRRREAVGLLFAKARAGSLPAIRKVLQLTAATAAAGQPAPAKKLGKKAAAQQTARTAGEGSEWGDDLMPADGHPH